ncbi:hypothetical protein BD779DRAFT_1094616 [Infundibulicybe gibba]|nr:hypothetical protein BD779DRAFT_1094616 [Infundibulicybe gibba]
MSNILLELPTEILIQLLSFLPAVDLGACQLVNRHFRHLIAGSSQLKYLIAIENAGLEDNPSCKSFDISQRLEMVTQRELSWRKFQPNFVQTINIPRMPSGIYDLTNGVYLIGALNHLSLSYVSLPTTPFQAATWSSINTDRPIIDMGLAIYEHDLIGIVTTGLDHSIASTPARHYIELSLLSFKTGKPHPLAKNPKIPVEVSRWPKPSISIEIVGDHLR